MFLDHMRRQSRRSPLRCSRYSPPSSPASPTAKTTRIAPRPKGATIAGMLHAIAEFARRLKAIFAGRLHKAAARPKAALFRSGGPHLAENVDEALAGFGER